MLVPEKSLKLHLLKYYSKHLHVSEHSVEKIYMALCMKYLFDICLVFLI